MATRIDPPDHFPDLLEDYRKGESILSISKRTEFSRTVITRWISETGEPIRDRSIAMYQRMKNATPRQRKEWAKAAHDAIRGRPRPRSASIAHAKSRGKVIGFGEDEILDAFKRRGVSVEGQFPVDIYNIDVFAWGRVAVEVNSGSYPKIHTLAKINNLSERGFVWICVTRGKRITPTHADEVVTLADLIRAKNPAPGEYWVVRCYLDRVVVERQPQKLSAVGNPKAKSRR